MSKEYLEAFEILLQHIETEADWSDYEKVKNAHKIVEQALQRLEAIDNAKPSEALECVEALKEDGCITTLYQGKALETIRQALLKAQEPKHYLKWEDLEFKIENQEMFVLLNGSYYLLEYYTDSEEEFVFIKATHTTVFELLGERSDDKQFFNDLHLERVEE